MSLVSPRDRKEVAPSDPDSLSISELYVRLDRALRGAIRGEVWVTGEIRSFSVSSRGHCYLELVDHAHARESSSPVLKVVCWSSRWARVRSTLDQLGIVLDAGLVVRVKGDVQLYKPRGEISFILAELDTEALLGRVAAERARLVKALVDEDLFDRNRRIGIPLVPLRIGLVASPGTEGYRDFLGQLESSGMGFAVRVAAAQVQGRLAARAVASGLRRLGAEGCDVIVIVRGGGSKADLAAFDAEAVARAVATSDVPIWTGIGHTGDQSVADEVANRSFITPTECGQELVRRVLGFWQAGTDAGAAIGRMAADHLIRSERALDHHRHGMVTCARAQLDRHGDRLTHRTQTLRRSASSQTSGRQQQLMTKSAILARSVGRALAIRDDALTGRARRLAALPTRRVQDEERRSGQWRRLLGAYDYQRQLERGYSVTRDADGRVVRSAQSLSAGSLLVTQLSDGEVSSTVLTGELRSAPAGSAASAAPGDASRTTGPHDARDTDGDGAPAGRYRGNDEGKQ